MFVRFVTGAEDENVFHLEGVIAAASELVDGGTLYDYETRWLNEIFTWFNEHLPCPPFRRKLGSGEWTEHAVCWFYDRAGAPLERIWDIVALLKEHGSPVRLVTSRKPGKIVYCDQYQVVAERPYWTR